MQAPSATSLFWFGAAAEVQRAKELAQMEYKSEGRVINKYTPSR